MRKRLEKGGRLDRGRKYGNGIKTYRRKESGYRAAKAAGIGTREKPRSEDRGFPQNLLGYRDERNENRLRTAAHSGPSDPLPGAAFGKNSPDTGNPCTNFSLSTLYFYYSENCVISQAIF